MNIHAPRPPEGLSDPKIRQTLERLHRAARGDAFVLACLA